MVDFVCVVTGAKWWEPRSSKVSISLSSGSNVVGGGGDGVVNYCDMLWKLQSTDYNTCGSSLRVFLLLGESSKGLF
jgi:hypothetical protein